MKKIKKGGYTEIAILIIVFLVGLSVGCLVSKPGALNGINEEIMTCPPWDTLSRDTLYIKMVRPRNYKEGTEIDFHFHGLTK